MPQQDKIYYVTKEQYDILYNNGNKDGRFIYNDVVYTYDENATYYVPADGYGQFKEVFSYSKEVPEEDLGGYFIEDFSINNDARVPDSEDYYPFEFQYKDGKVYMFQVTVLNSESTITSGYGWAICRDKSFNIIIDIDNHGSPEHAQCILYHHDYFGYDHFTFKSHDQQYEKVEIKIYETQLHL